MSSCTIFTIILLVVVFAIECSTQEIDNINSIYYVSTKGQDTSDCGRTLNSSCGTLYFVSKRIMQKETHTFNTQDSLIFVYDGQNIEIIKQYFESYNESTTQPLYHPCLAIPFAPRTMTRQEFLINFNEDLITTMEDWFPNHICYNNDYADHIYANQYLFEVMQASSLDTIVVYLNHLRIDNYNTDDIPYGIIQNGNKSSVETSNTFVCSGCTFENITYSLPHAMFSYPINIINSSFINMTVFSPFLTGTTKISGCKFINSNFSGPFISIDTAIAFVHLLDHCQFINISTASSIIQVIGAPTIGFVLMVQRSVFENIISGAIISSETTSTNRPCTIDVGDVFISTSQIQNEHSLFQFRFTDTVTLSNINVQYYYDWITYCDNVSSAGVSCKNPITLIENYGVTTISGMSVSINITLDDFYQYKQMFFPLKQYIFMLYDCQSDYELPCRCSILCNMNKMTINGLNVEGVPFANLFIQTQGPLQLHHMVINASEFIINSVFNPNVLQSQTILWISPMSVNAHMLFSVSNSTFTGSQMQLFFHGMEDASHINITTSVFQYASQAISATVTGRLLDSDPITVLTINNSRFYRIGRYYGSWWLVIYQKLISTTQTMTSNSFMYLEGNAFSCYDPSGFIQSQTHITLKNSSFTVDYTGIYYNVSILGVAIEFDVRGLIQLYGNSSLTLNTFELNEVDVTTPWIHYTTVYGIHCLSGNHFTNFAFALHHANVTSCFRPQLMHCFDDVRHCMDGGYGLIQHQNYVQSIFTITHHIDNIFEANDHYVALDNIQIAMVNTSKQNKPLSMRNGSIFLLDTILMSNNHEMDIWFDDSLCNVLYNDRLQTKPNFISKILITCHESNAGNLIPSMQSVNTATVQHFSAIELDFFALGSTYWPGSYLTFDYSIMDMFGNVLHKSAFNFSYAPLIVNVVNANLSLFAPISLDDGCALCHSGIIIFGASLMTDITEHYKIQTNLEAQYLLLVDEHRQTDLEIIGCPVGYGATDNKYQCQMCPTGTYNLVSNNTAACKSCTENINDVVQCIDGSVYIQHNSWMRIKHGQITSAICPYQSCCQTKTKCEFGHDESMLCPSNRDPTSTLCSECMNGFSEVFQSTACKKCDQHQLYPLSILYVVTFGLFIALYLLYAQTDIVNVNADESSNNESESHSDRSFVQLSKTYLTKVSSSHLFCMVRVLLFNGIIYYEQALSQILIHSNANTSEVFAWWISLFNISILQTKSKTNDGYCLYDGMTPKTSLLFGFVILFVILLVLMVCKCIHLCHKTIGVRLCGHQYELTTHYGNTFLCFLLLSVGNISSILFSLLSCQTINNDDITVHFNFGYEECFGVTWTLALLGLVSLILLFTFLFYILRRDNSNSLTKHYKPSCYYWEFIIFLRRIVLAFLSISFHSKYAKFLLLFMLSGYLYAHHRHQPFVFEQMNRMEFLLTLCLCGVIVMDIGFVEDIAWNMAVTVFGIVPFLLTAYYVISYGVNHRKSEPRVGDDQVVSNRYALMVNS
eukprot:50709_1